MRVCERWVDEMLRRVDVMKRSCDNHRHNLTSAERQEDARVCESPHPQLVGVAHTHGMHAGGDNSVYLLHLLHISRPDKGDREGGYTFPQQVPQHLRDVDKQTLCRLHTGWLHQVC